MNGISSLLSPSKIFCKIRALVKKCQFNKFGSLDCMEMAKPGINNFTKVWKMRQAYVPSKGTLLEALDDLEAEGKECVLLLNMLDTRASA